MISRADALFVLGPYFEAAQAIFVERGLRRCEKTRLVITERAHDTERHFAATRSDGTSIILAPELVGMPEDNVAAILAHEFGHAADFLYPGRFQLIETRLAEWEGPEWTAVRERDIDARMAYARGRQWERRDADEIERTADAIAEAITGRPIFYGGPCVLQSFEEGMRPRPPGLR